MMLPDDRAMMERAVLLRRLVAESLARRTPQERDRLMQVFLAQARGPAKNAAALRGMITFLWRARGRITNELPLHA